MRQVLMWAKTLPNATLEPENIMAALNQSFFPICPGPPPHRFHEQQQVTTFFDHRCQVRNLLHSTGPDNATIRA